MSKLFKRAFAGAMALGMILPLGIPASAAPKTPYSITVEKNTLRIMNGTRIQRSYPLENTEIRLMRSTKDNLLVGFTKKNEKKATNLVVGTQNSVKINGELSDLTLSSSLPSDWEVILDGKVDTMTVDCAAKTILDDDAQVDSLTITNVTADVSAVTGSRIKETTAATGVKIKNIKKHTSTTTNKTENRPQAAKIKTFVDFEDRDEQKFTRSTGFDTNEIILEARSGYPVGTAVRDIKITVYEETNSNRKVSGKWEFVNPSDADSTEDKTYIYRFTPNDQERYGTHEIKVNFTGAGEKRGLKRPGLHFEDRSHGNGNFSIEVNFPSTVEDDDELYIYITDKDGKKTTENYSLSRSDAGETETYSLSVTGNSGDRFKIKVKIKREHGSDSPYSDSITYEID